MPVKRQLSNTGVSQGVPQIADLARLVDAHVQGGPLLLRTSVASGRSRSWRRTEALQRKIGDHVAVVAEDCLIPGQEVFDVLQPSGRIEEDRLVAKRDGHAAPQAVREIFPVHVRAVVRVDDEAIDAGRQKMVHHVGDNGAAAQGKERLRAMLGQRPEPGAQTRRPG